MYVLFIHAVKYIYIINTLKSNNDFKREYGRPRAVEVSI